MDDNDGIKEIIRLLKDITIYSKVKMDLCRLFCKIYLKIPTHTKFFTAVIRKNGISLSPIQLYTICTIVHTAIPRVVYNTILSICAKNVNKS